VIRRELICFGAYPEISLAQAREERRKARELIGQGIDPAEAIFICDLASPGRYTPDGNFLLVILITWIAL
jgi:hypothetical protein